MTRTGTARGRKQYSYYSCAGCQQKGKSVCRGRHMPMKKLDDMVLQNVKDRLLQPERLTTILQALVERRSRQDEAVAARIDKLDAEASQIKEKLARLYRAIEEGVIDLDADLKERIQALKSQRDIAQSSLDRITPQATTPSGITTDRIDAFSKMMRDKLDLGDTQARKAYLRAMISMVEVDDGKVRIVGEKATLASVIAGRQSNFKNVRGFVREWRARHDSNV